jgi:hypothetical protein
MLLENAYWPNRDRLIKLGKDNAERYRTAEPFPHIVLDDFFPESTLNNILSEFPRPDDADWVTFQRTHEKKLAGKGDIQMGQMTRHFVSQLNASAFVDFLEALTTIKGVIPDPHLDGGGLHQIMPGGHLNIHTDFNKHKRLKLDRRINLLLYLNHDWQEDYRGHLELWDKDMTNCVEKILPAFNRMVIFSTTDFSYHGHPDPLACPDDNSRKSLALYYFTNGRPREEVKPGQLTQFRTRPGDKMPLALDVLTLKLMPPILIDAAKAIKDKLKK